MASRNSAGETLRAIAREILAQADRAIVDRDLSNAAAVHEFRKRMKRWRALLRLLEPSCGRKVRDLRLEARDLARSLAGPRDAQSAIDAFDDAFKHSTHISDRSLQAARDRLENTRRRAEHASLNGTARRRISAALHNAGGAIGHWPLRKLTADDLSRRLTDTYRRARRRLPKDWNRVAPGELHQLRQRIIELRYLLELLKPLYPTLDKPRVGDLQKLRDRLGRFQDLVLLANLTEPKQPLAPWRKRLVRLLADRQAVHLAAAARISRRLFAERPKAFRRRLRAGRNARGSN